MKNNKGFSLVELIVVVLIIAIIAVALAPQVIKWVSKAGENVDIGNAAEIKSCAQTALAEYLGSGENVDTELVYYVTSNGLYSDAAGNTAVDLDSDLLAKLIDETMKGDYPELHSSADAYKIVISADKVITVSQAN